MEQKLQNKITKDKTGSSGRNVNLDLIRCVAVFTVVAVHFFLNSEFYSQMMVGKTMYILTITRTAFMVCVPLFALLTGYLNNRKELSKAYYKRIAPILSTYFLASVLCILYKQIVCGEYNSLLDCIFMILNLDGGAIGYSWYINMYIGLFLLIPFLNTLYHGLKDQKQKKLLVATMLILTVAPSFFNSIDWYKPLFLIDPERRLSSQRIIPDWWKEFWPITYYFIGAYLSEFDVKLSKRWNVVLWAASTLVFGSYYFYCSYGKYNLHAIDDGWGNYVYTIESVLLFLLLLHVDLSRLPRMINWLLRKISKLSLGIYLCSYISDDYFYEWFLQAVPNQYMRYLWAPAAVVTSFAMAAMMSQLIAWVQVIIRWSTTKGKNVIQSVNGV